MPPTTPLEIKIIRNGTRVEPEPGPHTSIIAGKHVTRVAEGRRIQFATEPGAQGLNISFARSPFGPGVDATNVQYHLPMPVLARFVDAPGQPDVNRYVYRCRVMIGGQLFDTGGGEMEVIRDA